MKLKLKNKIMTIDFDEDIHSAAHSVCSKAEIADFTFLEEGEI